MTITVGTNSYVSEDYLSDYCSEAGLTVPADPEAALKQATKAIDRLYGARFIGTKESSTQPLAWPRVVGLSLEGPTHWITTDAFGNPRDFSTTPIEVEQATCELAVMIDASVDVYAQPQPRVTLDRVKVDVIETSQQYAGGGHMVDPLFKIKLILAPLLWQPTLKFVR